MDASLTARGRGNAYLLLHRLSGSSLDSHYRAFLRQDQARDYPDTDALLARTLEHAVLTVPHYHGVTTVDEIRADPVAALAAFPVLTRDTVREEGEALLSTEGDRSEWTENTSGGSTGEPVELFQDPDHLARTVAIREVYSTWVGGRLGNPELYIWGSERDVEGARTSVRNRFGNRLLRRSLLNAFVLTDDSIRSILEEITNGPPRLVVAYAQACYEVARFATREEISLPPQVAVIATAGTLYDFMRDQIEQTFGCPVVNRYGSRETGDMAGECLHHRGLHVLPWCTHVELLDDDGRQVAEGEEGEVIVTGLTNRAMPLIRYRIGDRAIAGSGERCPCGRDTPMLAGVTGRSVDMFFGGDGRMVDGEYFTHLLYFRPWLRQFQVIQRQTDLVVYRLVADGPIPEADRSELIEKTKAALGDECNVEIEMVDSIEPSSSGKLRYTIRDF